MRLSFGLECGERPDGRCEECNEKTIIIVAPVDWNVYTAQELPEDTSPDVRVEHEEISAHYCMACGKIRSLSVNATV